MNTERILVPIDFSDCSRLLVAEAATLAARLHADLTLLHVVQPPEGLATDVIIQPVASGDPVQVGRYLVEAAESRLPTYAEVAQAAGVKVTSKVALGQVGPTIVDTAEAEHDLIFMATHGRRNVARWLMGSVAEFVTRHARVPVMTLRTEHRPDCAARNCQWCSTHVMPGQQQVSVETDG